VLEALPTNRVLDDSVWAARELDATISAAGFVPVLALRPQATWRAVREQGLWLQWEGIFRCMS
jgi:hypothetical protein